jgi:hypothetical protein
MVEAKISIVAKYTVFPRPVHQLETRKTTTTLIAASGDLTMSMLLLLLLYAAFQSVASTRHDDKNISDNRVVPRECW